MQKPIHADNIKVAKKIYYSSDSYLPDRNDTGFIKRCKAILSAGDLDMEMPKELQQLILS